LVAKEECFALKGGTAINFFWWDFPRLSVDIHLTYVHIKGRKESLEEISSRLVEMKTGIEKAIPGSSVTPHKPFQANE